MGLKHEIKHGLNYVLFSLKNVFKYKEKVVIPVYNDELLKGRCALILGGTSGIGLSIANLFAQNQCDLVITGRNTAKLDKIKQEFEKKYKVSIVTVELDLRNVIDFDKVIINAHNLINKKIDILVNNAGIMSECTFGNTTEEDFDDVLQTNLKGIYMFSQAFIKYMLKNKIKGNILNISSTSENRPVLNPYSLSKWSRKGFTIGLAKKYYDKGIVVNAIAPGPTATKMLLKDKSKNSLSLSQYPLDRYVTPEEIANVALFLTSSMGRMIVGQTIFVSGGIGVTTIDDINY